MFCIKPLRLSNFRTHLELLEECGVGDDCACPAASMPGAADGPWRSSDPVQYAFDRMATTGSYVPLDRLATLYGDTPPSAGGAEEPMPGRAKCRRELPRPRWSCDRDAVAAELRLRPGLTRAELHRIRRDFARSNHPDRVPPSWREEANQRMTIANALIDHALKETAAHRRMPG